MVCLGMLSYSSLAQTVFWFHDPQT